MRTCARFERIKSGYEQDITYLRNHPAQRGQHGGQDERDERTRCEVPHGQSSRPALRALPDMRVTDAITAGQTH
ncbi:hypothetical protein ABZY36_02595 [Streptomyces sp. NPDC006627]|uniref:hypothetical protein n=1 Tax=Streptomyces sp. NPDC006627 TaxID=3154679 RepID=UPI0033AF5DB3